MEIKQIYDITNSIVTEVTGKADLLQENLGNIADVGDAVFNATSYDKFCQSLVDAIGKRVFVTRPYNGIYAKLMMDAWEFGAVLQKVTMELPNAEENESWELTDGAVYEENQFYKPTISAKFFNTRTTWEVPMSITNEQIKSAFTDATQMNSFVTMIFNAIENAFTIRAEELTRRAVNNMIGETLYDEYQGGSLSATSHVKAVNLLYLYNQIASTPITKADALHDKEFIRFANLTMGLHITRLQSMSVLYNIGEKQRFTPKEDLHFVLLNEFAKASEVYLESDTYHDNLVKLDGYEEVPYFQGTGTTYAFDKTSAINIKTASGNVVSTDGIIGCMFDKDAVVVCNQKRRTTSKYNAKAEFTNYWYKAEGQYINDTNENFIVFFIQ